MVIHRFNKINNSNNKLLVLLHYLGTMFVCRCCTVSRGTAKQSRTMLKDMCHHVVSIVICINVAAD